MLWKYRKLNELPEWVPNIDTVIEITPLVGEYLPVLLCNKYRAKVKSVFTLSPTVYEIEMEGFSEKIRLEEDKQVPWLRPSCFNITLSL